MKKILFISFVCMAALSSCEKTIYPTYSNDDVVLGLSARLNTGDRLHTVFVDYCSHDSVVGALDATVNIFVNGIPAGSSSKPYYIPKEEFRHSYRTDPAAWYYVSADIKPGDKVKVEATAGKYRAEATAIAPPAPMLGNVSMTEHNLTTDGEDYEELRFNVEVKDVPHEKNYYAVSVVSYKEYPESQAETELVEMDYSHDVLLFKHNNRDIYGSCSYPFSDSSFDGGSAALDLRVRKDMFTRYGEAVKITATVRLSAITMEDYDTYAMSERYLPDLPGLNTIVLVYPSNVIGGIGQVYVRSDTEVPFDINL